MAEGDLMCSYHSVQFPPKFLRQTHTITGLINRRLDFNHHCHGAYIEESVGVFPISIVLYHDQRFRWM